MVTQVKIKRRKHKRTPYIGVELKIGFPDGHVEIFKSISEGARAIGMHQSAIHRYLRGEYKTNKKGYIFNT